MTLVNNWIKNEFSITLEIYKQELDCAGMVFSVHAYRFQCNLFKKKNQSLECMES